MKRPCRGVALGVLVLLAALTAPLPARADHVYWSDRASDDPRPVPERFGPDVNVRVFQDFALLIAATPVPSDRLGRFEPVRLPEGTVPALARLYASPDGLGPGEPTGLPVLRRGGELALVAAPATGGSFGHHLERLAFTPRVTSAPSSPLGKRTVDPAIKTEIVDAVDEAAISRIVGELSGWFSFELGGETITNDDRFSCRIAHRTAADYLEDRFATLGYTVSRQTFTVPCGASTRNVVAAKTGTTLPEEIVVVGGHYDSTSRMDDPAGPAPGAEDNASGTAVVLHLAELFARRPTERTVHFVAFGGEEQGLFGSRHYVQQALLQGYNIVAVLIADMVSAYQLRFQIDIEGLPDWPALNELMDLYDANVAGFATPLVTEQKFNSFGSDHVPFQDAGIPALLVIESDYAQYPHYHTTRDTWDKLDFPLGTDVARATAATLADLAQPGATVPTVVSSLAAAPDGDAVRLAWDVVDGAGLLGFHVLRAADGEPWQRRTLEPLPAVPGRMRFEDPVADLARPVTLRYALEAVGNAGAFRLPQEAWLTLAPAAFWLAQNHPNPFNPSTTITFHLPETRQVALRVFDIGGREVAELLDRSLGPGDHTVHWDGRDATGRRVSSGVYYYQLRDEREIATRRMVLLE